MQTPPTDVKFVFKFIEIVKPKIGFLI